MNSLAIDINIENAYYQMASVLNTSTYIDEIILAINNALESIINFPEISSNNLFVHNILLIGRIFIRDYEERYYYYDSFQILKSNYEALTTPKNAQKR